MPEHKKLLCENLPTSPNPEKGIVLVTGATGYIGGLLVPELLARNYKVRVLVRSLSEDFKNRWPGAEVVIGDVLIPEQLNIALQGVDTAYYLIHSLLLGEKKFEEIDIRAAKNFRVAAENQKVKQIIYLGGLGELGTGLSPHLKSRIHVAKELSDGPIPVTALRAGMIIGAGSASYEILSKLVQNSPIFFMPKWARTKAQPIAVGDVIKYLVGVLELDRAIDDDLEIGGSTIISYDEMLRDLTMMLRKRRLFFPALINTPAIYGFLASLLTPVPGSVTKALISGCKNEVICNNNDIRELIKFTPLTFDQAISEALKYKDNRKCS